VSKGKRINMTQEEIEAAVQMLREAAKLIDTPDKARQLLIDIGVVQPPKKKKKAQRRTK
jgi:hypothetical protein